MRSYSLANLIAYNAPQKKNGPNRAWMDDWIPKSSKHDALIDKPAECALAGRSIRSSDADHLEHVCARLGVVDCGVYVVQLWRAR